MKKDRKRIKPETFFRKMLFSKEYFQIVSSAPIIVIRSAREGEYISIKGNDDFFTCAYLCN
ncbi:MAG: hypothetical protein A3K09_00055 [Nitrospinae bacterium RIFCSPLOWO2_12_FULL_47_7]|nr:MAG: hypothetical protein A3K09_00055 [Nitrospinae bacterium RIFCSPLOWO2_12_FULL_47_7]